MSQTAPRFCSQCHSPVMGDARFCPNCGAPVDVNQGSLSSAQTSREDDIYSKGEGYQEAVPPPPPPTFPPSSAGKPYTNYNSPPAFASGSPMASNDGSSSPSSPTYPAVQNQNQNQNLRGGAFAAQAAAPVAPPRFDQPPKKRRRGGLIFGLILLALVVIAALAFAFFPRGSSPSQSGTSGSGSQATATSGSSNNTTPVPTSATTSANSGGQGTTTPLSSNVTYSGITFAFSNVQVASTFADDNATSADKPGALRVNFRETNNTSGSVYYNYSDIARLILADGTAVVPLNEKISSPPASQANQINWIDFQVPQNVDASKAILRLGTQTEAQMDVPLVGNADLSKYNDKTVTLNGTSNYSGLNWTLTQAVKSYSAGGKQVITGNRFVTVTLKVDNPTANTAYFEASNYLRLQTGTTKISPESGYTLPSSYAPGTSNTTGTVTFTMPDTSSSYSLIFLPQSNISQSSINFQIP